MRQRLRQALASAALVLGLAVPLAGCGFRPLYGNTATVAALSRIDIRVSQGRIGFLLREQLQDQLAWDRGAPAAYRLALDYKQARYPFGGRVNNVANRYELRIDVGFVLTDIATGRVLRRGALPVAVSYDSADPPYAGVTAEQNAEERAASLAAVQLRLELARYFGGLISNTPPPTRITAGPPTPGP